MKFLTIRNICAIAFFSFAVLACDNSTEKKAENVEIAKEKVIIATDALDKARADSANEYQLYKEASDRKISENNDKILALKEEIRLEKSETRMKNQKELDELDHKNLKLKLRMEQYKHADRNSWDAFKLSFNKDLDELGKSISELAHKNLDK
jgi:hypothetical protein